MDIATLKQDILSGGYIESILSEIGCHHISNKHEYITCGNPDGDNPIAITVYLNENLTVIDYTRTLNKNKTCTDIFDLVEYFTGFGFYKSVKYVCELTGIDYYYSKDDDYEIPESLLITQQLMSFIHGDSYEIDKPVKPIPNQILSYYKPYVNDMFYNDNIDYSVQCEFEIGYDDETNYITIPIRDELNNLVGVKGRYFGEPDDAHTKYTYLYRCPKGKILYGLNKTEKYIRETGICYITEAEKGVLQLFSYGYNNCVSTGGSKMTQTQIDKLSRICSHVVFLYDKDIDISEIEILADKFVSFVTVDAVIDINDILLDKESPTDNKDKLKELLQTSIVRIKDGI